LELERIGVRAVGARVRRDRAREARALHRRARVLVVVPAPAERVGEAPALDAQRARAVPAHVELLAQRTLVALRLDEELAQHARAVRGRSLVLEHALDLVA